SGNGRFYSLSRINFGNPEIARMLSPDNYVQAPDFTQNFNRYSYCLNNPLKYTDPTGNNYVSDMYHGNNGGGSYFIGFGSTNMSRILGDHSGFCDYNPRNERSYVTDGKGNVAWVDSKDYLTGNDAAEYLASIGIKSFEDLINNINGGKNKKEGEAYSSGDKTEFNKKGFINGLQGVNMETKKIIRKYKKWRIMFDGTQPNKDKYLDTSTSPYTLYIYRPMRTERHGQEMWLDNQKYKYDTNRQYFRFQETQFDGKNTWKWGSFPINHPRNPNGTKLLWEID
ncbi:MAG: hypothetical protein DRJ01_13020, partial [Bacteroidetes bacterium]